MILRSLRLRDWRAHRQLDLEFGSGLNLITGRNEAGKSTLVEAIEWALYRDVTGSRLSSEAVRAIIPATDPSARPNVCVVVEFCDCSALYSKTLALDSGRRECRLIVQRPGHADEHFERDEAQKRWRELVACDGAGIECGARAEGALLVARQGHGLDFLGGLGALHATLGVSQAGELALTQRLEGARRELERLRASELQNTLKPRALDMARLSSQAGRARAEATRLSDERAQVKALAGEIEALRDEIEAVEAGLTSLREREMTAAERTQNMGALHTAQAEAEAKLSQAQTASKQASQELERAKEHIADIERRMAERQKTQDDIALARQRLEQLEAERGQAQATWRAAQGEVEAREKEFEEARSLVEAWRDVLEVHDANAASKAALAASAHFEDAVQRVREAQNVLDACPAAPQKQDVARWREEFAVWRSLEAQARRGLRFEVRPAPSTNPPLILWRGDCDGDQQPQPLDLKDGAPVRLSAMARASLEIEGLGTISCHAGSRGIEEMRAELDEKRDALTNGLAPWNVPFEALPAAFDELGQRVQARLSASRNLDEAQRALGELEKREGGSLAHTDERVREARARLEHARERALSHEERIEFLGMKRAQVTACLDQSRARAQELKAFATRARNLANEAEQTLRRHDADLAAAQIQPQTLQARLDDLSVRLAELFRSPIVALEALSPNAGAPEEPETQVDQEPAQRHKTILAGLDAAVIEARMQLRSAQEARQALGDGVSNWKVEEARRAHFALIEERADQEKRLAALMATLQLHCSRDPLARLAELDARLEELMPQVEAHEARLRGIMLLEAAMNEQRARLSRDLAGPINHELAPWLSELRGKPTALVFEADGSRIERIRTTEAVEAGGGDTSSAPDQTDGLPASGNVSSRSATIELPFSEHSEGMKEQVAFSLRLLLARRVARHLPSRRLPVVLDDPFTQSDSSRGAGLGTVLSEAAHDLQLFFVTCHTPPPAPKAHLIQLGMPLSEAPAPDSNAKKAPGDEKSIARDTEPSTKKRRPKRSQAEPPSQKSQTPTADQSLSLFGSESSS